MPERSTLVSTNHQQQPGLIQDFKNTVEIVSRLWWIVAISLTICLTISIVYLARRRIEYQATCRLLILQQGVSPLSSTGTDSVRVLEGGEDYLPTHALILRSPLIVGRAIESLGWKDVSTRQAIGGLSITRPDPFAKILQVNYRSHDRESALKIIDAVTESYQKFLDKKYKKNSQDAISLIKKARDELGRELQDLERKYLEFRQEGRTLTTDESGRPFLSRRLDQWDHAANEAMLKAVRLKAQLDQAHKFEAEGMSLTATTHALGHLAEGLNRAGDDGSRTGSALHRQIEDELVDVEIQRTATERLIEQYRSKLQIEGKDPKLLEGALVNAFYADPEVSQLYGKLRNVRSKKDQVQRQVRDATDISMSLIIKQEARLQSEIARLWRQLRPRLADQLENQSNTELNNNIKSAEMNLITFKVREKALRDELIKLDEFQISRLNERSKRMTAELGVDHPEVKGLKERITQIQKGVVDPLGNRDRNGFRELIGAIQASLESVEAMRSEIRKRFDEDMVALKKVEVDHLTESNLRNNLERQRTMFNTVVDRLKQAQLTGDFSGITAQTIDPPSASAVGPQTEMLLGLGTVLGLILGMVIAVISDHMDQRLRTVNEIRRTLDLVTLGMIPKLSVAASRNRELIGLMAHVSPRSPMAESYRIVRTNMDMLSKNKDSQTILITSPLPGDGKTTTASNLAISMAHSGRRVLLVDADLRRPKLDKIHLLNRDRGLVQILNEDGRPVHHEITRSRITNLDIMTAGLNAANPAELLASSRMIELLEEIKQMYDLVILDSAPLLTVADSSILAGLVDGIVLVVGSTSLRRHDAEQTLLVLQSVGAPVLGVVINQVEKLKHYYGYGYGEVETAYDEIVGGGRIGSIKPMVDLMSPHAQSEALVSLEGSATRDDRLQPIELNGFHSKT